MDLAAPTPRQTRSQRDLWTLGVLPVLALGALAGLLGIYWDVAWHIDVGRNTFFTPPHNFLYASIAVVLATSLYSLLRDRRDTPFHVRWGTLRLHPGVLIVALGAALELLFAPMDELWHQLFGLDVTLWAPMHLIGIPGLTLASFGSLVSAWLKLRLAMVRVGRSESPQVDSPRERKKMTLKRTWRRWAGLWLALLIPFPAVTAQDMPGGSTRPGNATTRPSPFTSVPPAAFSAVLRGTPQLTLINVHVPYEGELAGTDAFIAFDRIARQRNRLPHDKAAAIAVYCMSGRMSDVAARTLRDLGYTDVTELQGGMIAWHRAGFPLKDR